MNSDKNEKNLTEMIATVRQTLAERLPRLVSTTAKGLIPLSLALGLAPLIHGTPEDVFIYLAGLAPNFISDMLLAMRLGERPLDVDDLAEALAERLDEPGLQRISDELEIITSIAQALQAQGEQLKELSQSLSRELDRAGWQVPPEAQVIIADMVAQGQYIAQAKDGSTAIVVGPGSTLNYSLPRPDVRRKRFLRILIGSADDLERERHVVKDAIKSLYLEPAWPELELSGSLSVSTLEAYRTVIRDCDIYLGLLGGRYGHQALDGKSVTQFEIEKARELGKPVLLYRKLLPDEEIEEPQKALIAHLSNNKHGYHVHSFSVLGKSPGERHHNLGRNLSGILPDVNKRLRTTLLNCDVFASNTELRGVFVDARLSPWRNRVPEASSPASRVRAIINLLHYQYSDTQENALVLLLRVLSDHIDPGDALHHQLIELADELEHEKGPHQALPTSPNTSGLFEQIQKDIQALLSGEFDKMPQPRARVKPTSGRRGLIASLGRSPGAVTGLYHALEQANVPIDYVRTISTSEFQVQRAVKAVQRELTRQGVKDYADIPLSAKDLTDENVVMDFKAAFSQLLAEVRDNGDAVAIGITGGRTVMGALLTLVAQMEAPTDSNFYQLTVPAAIEEDGRYPRFHNQPEQRKAQVLRPTEFFPDECHLIEIPFSRFYDDTQEVA
jgi:hypothetical protein